MPYARLLGSSERGKKLLRDRARYSDIPIVTRLAAVEDPVGKLTAAAEFRASKLYELLLPKPELDHEERQRPRFER